MKSAHTLWTVFRLSMMVPIACDRGQRSSICDTSAKLILYSTLRGERWGGLLQEQGGFWTWNVRRMKDGRRAKSRHFLGRWTGGKLVVG
jgi:hypothetical protein